jgi:uncharacterized membrane protein YfcA
VPLLAIPLGLLVGLSLGALGGGGSILTVPALVHVLGQTPRAATTSSLVIVGITSLIALVHHARARRVRFGQGTLFGVLGTAGSVLGTALSTSVTPNLLLLLFAGLMLVVASLMLRRARRSVRHPSDVLDPPNEPLLTLRPFTCACPRLAKVIGTASLVGLLTGFFGVGGGFVLVPALVLALGFSMPTAVGTSLLVIAVNSATALVARLATSAAGAGASAAGASAASELDWPLITTFTVVAVAASVVGGRVAARADPRHLTASFAVLMVVVALYTAATSLSLLG